MRNLPKKLFVICKKCGEKHGQGDVKTIDIEEDVQGRDVLIFICPITNLRSSYYIYIEKND